MTTKTKETKKRDSHYVSQCEPPSVDTNHAVLTEAHGVPFNTETTKDQFVRKHETGIVEKGSPDNRKVKKTSVAERHVSSEPGFTTKDRRSAFLKQTRKQNEKVFDKK